MPVSNSEGERISLCMIVRNEERFMRDCLNSVRDTVDEIIVVDTGSTDNTIEICRSFGARVVKFQWTDDFSAARNHGLQHATGDWILYLDADEVMDTSDAVQLRGAIQSADAEFFALRMIHFVRDTPSADESYQVFLLRLFKNGKGIRFQDKIHERLDVPGVAKIVNLPIRVYHHGYMPSVMKLKNKHTRNMQIINREMACPDHSPWLHYHSASEYYNIGEYYKALNQLDLGNLMFILRGLKPPSLCYRLKYIILLQLKETDKALQSIDKALAIYADYVDLHFIKGLLLLESNDHVNARETFAHCLDLGEGSGADHLTLKGVGSFRAWYYRGRCLEQMGQTEAAQSAYESSLSISPQFEPSRDALEALRSISGSDSESRK